VRASREGRLNPQTRTHSDVLWDADGRGGSHAVKAVSSPKMTGHRRFPEVSWAIDGDHAPVSDKASEFALPRSELAWNCFLGPPPAGEDHEIKR